MPRKPRFNLPGIPQHIIQRGNYRSPCFLSEKDYQRYLADLKMAADKYGCKIHAFVNNQGYIHIKKIIEKALEKALGLVFHCAARNKKVTRARTVQLLRQAE